VLDTVRKFGKIEVQLDPVTRRRALSHFPRRQQRLVKKQIRVNPRLVPSTHLAPCEFWRFPSLRVGLSGHRFISVGEIQLKSTTGLTFIPQEAPKAACRSGRTVGVACACWSARAELLAYVLYYTYIFYYKLCLRSGTYNKRRVNTVLNSNHWNSRLFFLMT
jgi:hypothetical protein